MSLGRFNNDLPDPAKEKVKCHELLENYRDMTGDKKYINILQSIANREVQELPIALDDIITMNNDQDFVSNILRNTLRYIRYFEEVADTLLPPPSNPYLTHDVVDVIEMQRIAALQRAGRVIENGGSDLPKSLLRRYQVIFLPLTSSKPRSLRDIHAEDIGHLVYIKGLVTRASLVRPHCQVVTYTCEVCGSEVFQEVSGPSFMPLTACPSQRCQEHRGNQQSASQGGGKLTLQTRGSKFLRHQELRLQELPDQLPVGHVPRSVLLHCLGQATRQAGPGEIITVAAIFLPIRYGGFKGMQAGLQTDTYLLAMNIQKQRLNYQEMIQMIGETGGGQIADAVRRIARDVDPYSRLARAIAPEIFGHEDVKKALLLQLVGGVTRDMADGMRIRGDVNLLLVGDPGVAKSQLLRYVSSIAPRGVYTTGKGSSSAGLTAALIRDTVSGELALEAGALVLADKGICCIDEFDKMNETDRTGIHEVMEQQTVSIAKGGITASLNARTSVLAAANPLYGRYNLRKSISENIDLPSSLLSRFDLVFLLLDRNDYQKDLALSKHVLHVHKHLTSQGAGGELGERDDDALSQEVFKQYIALAKTFEPSVPPHLTDYIVEAYVSLRTNANSSSSTNNTKGLLDQAVMTPRQLLSILRLSQALARLRLDRLISAQDVDEAIRLTHASKASLTDVLYGQTGTGGAGGGRGGEEDSSSAIFAVIKELATGRGRQVLEEEVVLTYAQVEATVLKKGFTIQQLHRCLSDYQAIGVLKVDPAHTHIDLYFS